jgi:hypothetical protein
MQDGSDESADLGDYNQAVAQDGELFAAWAGTERPPLGFTDGQPSPTMTTPDAVFRRYSPAVDEEDDNGIKPTTLDLQRVSFTDSGGNGHLDPGETATFRFLLRNYVTNPLNAAKVRGIQATLSTSTPGVLVTASHSNYANIDPGASAWNKQDFVVSLLPSFVAGTAIEFQLDVRTADSGSATLLATRLPARLYRRSLSEVSTERCRALHRVGCRAWSRPQHGPVDHVECLLRHVKRRVPCQ